MPPFGFPARYPAGGHASDDQLIARGNARFVAEEFEPNAEHYQTTAAKPTPKALWIGCSDSRVSEHRMTGSKPGTMFVHRNVANIVAFNDVNISSILEYGVAKPGRPRRRHGRPG